MKLQCSAQLPKLHNKFEIRVIEKDTGDIVQKAYAENTVLDAFYHDIMRNELWWREGSQASTVGSLSYGDGTGTISSSRTTLFAQKGVQAVTGVNIDITDDLVTITGVAILDESTYVGGIITEVGLNIRKLSGARLISHALLEDSEGSPISIGPKTGTQIIELYFTVYIERAVGTIAFPNRFSSVFTGVSASSGYRFFNDTIRLQPQDVGLPVNPSTYDPLTRTITTNVIRIATSAGNSYPVFTHVNMPNFIDELIAFPDSDVFPTYTFAERQIGIGDGTKRLFNIPTAIFKPGTEVIKVGGVVQTAGADYVVQLGGPLTDIVPPVTNQPLYGRDDRPTVYATDASKVITSTLGVMVTKDVPNYASGSYMLFEFPREIGIETLTIRKTSSSDYPVYFSVDGVNWSSTADLVITGSASNDRTGTLTTPVVAKYMWIGGRVQTLVVKGGPNILFTVAPANTSVITASWDCEYPPKHDMLFYDVQLAITANW